MKRLNGREMKAFFVLSIVVPVGFLTTLKLTGMLGQTIIAETKTLEPVKWEFQRPQVELAIADELNASRADGDLSLAVHLRIGSYHNDSVDSLLGGHYISVRISMNATSLNRNGFIDSVKVIFRNDSQPSLVDFLRTDFVFVNLSLRSTENAWNPESSVKAYAELDGIGRPRTIYFSTIAIWFLLDDSSHQTHQIEAFYELTYYNGTAYTKITQPFQLNLLGA